MRIFGRNFIKLKLTQYNDPIYGFITIPTPFVAKLVNHPYVQRLRRIKQMGLSFLVFPTTEHTRFQHALGAMHLATKAVSALRQQQVKISDEEAEALYICMLLHDLGHGPFSHALEHVLLRQNIHEDMSVALMQQLNIEYDGKLTLALTMFKNSYSRAFFHQLIASHIDLDRLDYLKRDSFYSGVTEGNINSERLISMMMVQDDQLVFNTKAVYSIEKFLLARRMMYWSVYLHKTSFIAEELLVRFFDRAATLIQSKKEVKTSTALGYFLRNIDTGVNEKLACFVKLDDADVWMMLKDAISNEDAVLSTLANMLLHRKLPKIKLAYEPFDEVELQKKRTKISEKYGLTQDQSEYFVFSGSLEIQGYQQKENPIKLCNQRGVCSLFDTSPATAQLNTLTKKDTKYFMAYPKGDGYFS
jgi:HD superfamily phosphohydrolase